MTSAAIPFGRSTTDPTRMQIRAGVAHRATIEAPQKVSQACVPRLWPIPIAVAPVGPDAADDLLITAIAQAALTGGGAADAEAALNSSVCNLARPTAEGADAFRAARPGTIREAFVLTQIGRCTCDQTADVLGMSVDQVSNASRAARDLLTAARSLSRRRVNRPAAWRVRQYSEVTHG